MPAKAVVDNAFWSRGVRIAISPSEGRILQFGPKSNAPVGETELAPEAWLNFTDEEARALYAALAQYYGDQVADARQLRKDYDDERSRVDKLISNLMGTSK